MNKTANIIGIVGTAFLFLSFLMKAGHFPGASIFLLLSLAIIVPLFFVLQGIASAKTNATHGFEAALGFSLVVLSLGTLFKALHWPGASIMFTVGFGGLLITLLVSLFFSLKKEEFQYKIKAHNVLTILLAVTLIATMYFIPRSQEAENFDKTFVENQLSSRKMAADFTIPLKNIDSTKIETAEIFMKQSSKIIEQIDSIKTQLLQHSNTSNFSELDNNQRNDYNTVGMLMIVEAKGLLLKKLLNEHKTFIEERESIFNLKEQTELFITTSDKKYNDGEILPWEIYMFEHKNVTTTFIILNEIETKVLLLRYMALSGLQNLPK